MERAVYGPAGCDGAAGGPQQGEGTHSSSFSVGPHASILTPRAMLRSSNASSSRRATTVVPDQVRPEPAREQRCERPLAGAGPVADFRQVQTATERHLQRHWFDRRQAVDCSQGLQHDRAFEGTFHWLLGGRDGVHHSGKEADAHPYAARVS